MIFIGEKTKTRIRIDVTIDCGLIYRLKKYSEKTMIPVSRIVEKSVKLYLDDEESKDEE